MATLPKLRNTAAEFIALGHDTLHTRVTDAVKANALKNAITAFAEYMIALIDARDHHNPKDKPHDPNHRTP